LTQAAFPAYLSDPRTTSFGLEDYDRFPKGTGHFAAPREWLLEAIEAFDSHYEDSRFASDDTHLLRPIAARQPINISPGFDSLYHSRTSFARFLVHAQHRGTTFVDGFARPGSRFFGVVVASFPLSLIGLGLAVRRPRAATGLAALGSVGAGALAARLGRPWRDVLSTAFLAPPFAVAYTTGIWRGAWLALKGRVRA
jgi:hypothetical protein